MAVVFVGVEGVKWIGGNEISEAIREQVEIDILAAIEDSEDHHAPQLDGKDDADPAPIADHPDGVGGVSDHTLPLSGNVERQRQ